MNEAEHIRTRLAWIRTILAGVRTAFTIVGFFIQLIILWHIFRA